MKSLDTESVVRVDDPSRSTIEREGTLVAIGGGQLEIEIRSDSRSSTIVVPVSMDEEMSVCRMLYGSMRITFEFCHPTAA